MALLLKTPTGSSPPGVASSVRKLFAQRKATVGREMHSRATPQVGPRSTQPAGPRLAVQRLARFLWGSNRYKRRPTNRPAHGAARMPFGRASGPGLDSGRRWSSLPHSVIAGETLSSRAKLCHRGRNSVIAGETLSSRAKLCRRGRNSVVAGETLSSRAKPSHRGRKLFIPSEARDLLRGYRTLR
jgi:hypothetical protein